MVYQFVGTPSNSYPGTGFVGGSVPGDANTGWVKREIVEVVDALEPYETPLYSMIKTGSSYEQNKIEWLQRRQRPHVSYLDVGISNVDTTITLPSQHRGILNINHMVYLRDPVAGDEVVWVRTVNLTAGTATVLRAQQQTTAVAHSAGTVLEVHAPAIPQNTDYIASGYTFGDWEFNYGQRMQDGVEMDDAARYQSNQEHSGDQLEYRLAEKVKDLKIGFEKQIINGRRQAGTPDPSGMIPSTFGGLQQFIKTNVKLLSNQPLTLFDIEDTIAKSWETSGPDTPKKILCNLNDKRIINKMMNKYRQGTLGDKGMTQKFDWVEFETGRVEFIVSRYVPKGYLFGIDLSKMSIHARKNLAWHQFELPVKSDRTFKVVAGEYTFKATHEARMFIIKGYDSNLLTYSQYDV